MLSRRTFALRRDLVIQPIEAAGDLLWVVLDPMASRYFYFDEQEYAVLQALDGGTSLADIARTLSRRFAPRLVTRAGLTQFLGQLADSGLLHGAASGQIDAPPHRTSTGWGQVFALRLPGFHPGTLLEALSPLTFWMFTPAGLCAWSGLVLLALLTLLGRFEDFVNGLPALRDWGTPDVAWSVVLALACTKVAHELGHALAAQKLGAQCESMGVLLLFGVPCMYCDVSRAWLLPRPRDRMLVSSAGILAEVGLAAAALLLWSASTSGPWRLVLATIVIAASVSTLLVNGNPLLRYDGYYILSDWLGIPNLAAESRLAWWELAFGAPPGRPASLQKSTRRTALLLAYGLAASVWRSLFILLTAYGFFLYFQTRDLRSVGSAVAVLILLLSLGVPAVRLAQSVRQEREANWTGRLALPAAALLVICGLWIPLPLRVDAPFRIELVASQQVYVTVPGELLWAAPPGQTIAAGEALAELRSPETERELARTEARLQTLETRRDGLEARRSLLPSVDELPPLLDEIAATHDRLTVLRLRAAELRMTAPVSGVWYSPPDIAPQPDDEHQIRIWSGTPLEEGVRGAPLERGVLLGEIGDPAGLRAVLYVSQRRVRLLRPGQSAQLWLGGAGEYGIPVEIDEISPAPVEAAPRELAARRLLAIDVRTNPPVPREPVYRVTARFRDQDTPAWPLRSTGRASVRVAWTTFWDQLSAFVFDKLDV